ncbi:restriction endonuclease subunit S [Lactococcus lactis]
MNNRLEKGDVVFTTEAPLGNVAQVPDNNGYILNQRAVAFKSLQETDDNFFAQLLRSPIVQNTLKASSSGGTAKGIGMKEFAKLNARVPETHEEQRKIGLFFKQLDDTIVLHQRKLDLLKEQKKGYLQKMFPKNGSKIPELRFAEFADDWEERKLGEVATFLNGRAYKQDELLDSGKYKVLRVGNFYTNDSWYYSNMELGDKYYVDKGDLVYTWSATFGPHIWSGEKVIYHYHIWKVELSKFLDRNFTLQLLEADKARLLSSTNGSTMIHVTKGDMESKIVSIPNIDEQKQIGSFFKQLDNTITLHQRKLDLLKEQKKGFLQKMFI